MRWWARCSIRLALAEHLYNGLRKALAFVAPRAASELAGMVLGLMLAPMNGSVGASLPTLARTAGKGWAAEGLPAAQRTALVAVTSTLGVIVPPSLVLLLLGDAMLRAHTEGVNMARTLALPTATANRIVNTQDILQAALVPAAALLLGWLAVAWFGARRSKPAATAAPREPMQPREGWTLLLVPLLIGALLVLVTLGRSARGRGRGRRLRAAARLGPGVAPAHASGAVAGARRRDGAHRRAVCAAGGGHHSLCCCAASAPTG